MVIDLWYDLTAHLAQDEIPSPDDSYRECHEIISEWTRWAVYSADRRF